MSDIATKKHLANNLVSFARDVDESGQWLQGQSWPVTVVSVEGAIVTVVFQVESEFTLPQVTCPIAESRYVRLPVQEGDQGYVVPASVRLGGVTGLGAGLAPLTLPSNLGALVYVPLGNLNWPTIDPNAVVIQAPNGAKILTDDGSSEIIVDTSQVKVTQGSTTVEITGGNVTITAPNNVTINCPENTINGDLTVNGNVTISGNSSIGGTMAVTGAATFSSSVACASFTCAGEASVGSLTIAGVSFTLHKHLPGSYKAGTTSITGESGGVGP